ncbi:MAG: hypothetical protein EZS28_021535 [Streblomastix strix]|uniref:Uncharacterized protein n=1 Tax=Streblomastix strix TaxID=222440 RepID=A0A5J4VKF0_9EUKA|nr:MAG: hypothetical protein EZS28_021535 [Streblomastix strix]
MRQLTHYADCVEQKNINQRLKFSKQSRLQKNLNPTNIPILTTFQQLIPNIHVKKKRTWINGNLSTQIIIEEGVPMNSSSYPSPSSSSEEDKRRADRCNDNSPTMARPDMVYRTGKRECSIPYTWLEQRNSGTRTITNTKEFKTLTKEDKLLLMDRRPGKEEDSRERFQEYQMYPREQLK